MTKIGLKLWNINTNDYLPLARELFQDGIFDYIELYVVPGHLDTLPRWSNEKMPFDIHAPHSAHGMNLADHSKATSNAQLYDETKTFADTLNARYIVFHGGTDGPYQEVANQLKLFGDKRSLIENKPHKPLPFVKAKQYVGSKPGEMQFIKDYAQCGFCLDIGHAVCSANSFSLNPYAFLDHLAELNPNKIHLSDIHINTEDDEHLNYGQGTLDFTAILPILKRVNDITIETNKKNKTNLDDFVSDVMFLRQLLS